MFGVDTNEFRKNIGGPRDISGTINIGSNRSHWPIYDVITLLKAAKILKRKNIESCRFIVSGLEGPETKSLKDYSKDNGLEDIVIFKKPYDPSRIKDFYNLIDIYVSCSLSDGGLSSSTAEAMSCGLVVVSADNSENKLWIEHGSNGTCLMILVKYSLLRFWKKWLKYISLNDLRAKARDTIIRRNSLEGEMKKVLSIYQSLLSQEIYIKP